MGAGVYKWDVASNPTSTSFRELLQQSSVGRVIEDAGAASKTPNPEFIAPRMITTPDIAERSPSPSVSAISEVPAGKGVFEAARAVSPRMTSLLALSPESSVGPMVEEPIQALGRSGPQRTLPDVTTALPIVEVVPASAAVARIATSEESIADPSALVPDERLPGLLVPAPQSSDESVVEAPVQASGFLKQQGTAPGVTPVPPGARPLASPVWARADTPAGMRVDIPTRAISEQSTVLLVASSRNSDESAVEAPVQPSGFPRPQGTPREVTATPPNTVSLSPLSVRARTDALAETSVDTSAWAPSERWTTLRALASLRSDGSVIEVPVQAGIASSPIAAPPSDSPVAIYPGKSSGREFYKAPGALNQQSASLFELLQSSSGHAAREFAPHFRSPLPAGTLASVVATVPDAGRSAALPVLAHAATAAETRVFGETRALNGRSATFSELMPQSSVQTPMDEITLASDSLKVEGSRPPFVAGSSTAILSSASADPAPAEALAGISQPHGGLSDLPHQGSDGLMHEASTRAPRSASKEGRRVKPNSKSTGPDAAVCLAPSEHLQVRLPLIFETGVADQARPQRSSTNQEEAVRPSALTVRGSEAQEQPDVEWSTDRDTGFPAELAFTLRLKPIASIAIAETPDLRTGQTSRELVGNFGAVPIGPSGHLATSQSAIASDPILQGGKENPNGGGPSTALKPALPDTSEKAEPLGRTGVPATVELAKAPKQQLDSLPTTLVHSSIGSALLEDPTPMKTAAQPAKAPATSSLEQEDQLTSARPMKEISLQVSSDGDRKVDVRLVQRAGEVLVSVRTQDVALAHEMRQELGSLTGKLAQSGYGTEQFAPPTSGSSNLSDRRDTPQNQDPSHGQGQDQRQAGSGQQQPQDDRGKRPVWLEEMETSLERRQSNRSKA